MLSRTMGIFTGNAHPALAEEIVKYLDCPLGRARITQFSDGETYALIQESVRGVDTYVIQPTCTPVNDRVMEPAEARRSASTMISSSMTRSLTGEQVGWMT